MSELGNSSGIDFQAELMIFEHDNVLNKARLKERKSEAEGLADRLNKGARDAEQGKVHVVSMFAPYDQSSNKYRW